MHTCICFSIIGVGVRGIPRLKPAWYAVVGAAEEKAARPSATRAERENFMTNHDNALKRGIYGFHFVQIEEG